MGIVSLFPLPFSGLYPRLLSQCFRQGRWFLSVVLPRFSFDWARLHCVGCGVFCCPVDRLHCRMPEPSRCIGIVFSSLPHVLRSLCVGIGCRCNCFKRHCRLLGIRSPQMGWPWGETGRGEMQIQRAFGQALCCGLFYVLAHQLCKADRDC